MKEEEVAYIAGVVDSIGLFRVKITEHNETSNGYYTRPQLRINRSGDEKVVLGMIDEYAMEVGVNPEVVDKGSSTQVVVQGVENLYRFIEPLEGMMVQKHEILEIFLEDILPAIENEKHTSKEGMIEVMEMVDKMSEIDNTLTHRKYNADYFKEKWGM